MSSPHQRRDVLRGIAAGGLASVASLAGCAQLPGDADLGGENDRPSYHEYVPAETGGSAGTSFVALDAERLRELGERDLQGELPEDANVDLEGGHERGTPDPMLVAPGTGLLVAVVGMSFGLAPYGFAGDVLGGLTEEFGGGAGPGGQDGSAGDGSDDGGSGDGDAGAGGPHRVDTAVMLDVDGAIVLDGSFDVGAVTDADDGFERAGEHAGFEVYEGTESDAVFDTENRAFAVDGSTIVALVGGDIDDPRARLDHALDVVAGDAERLSEDGDAEWALRSAGHGVVAIGGWGVDPVEEGTDGDQQGGGTAGASVLDGSDGVVSSLAFEDERVRATVAALFPEGETPDREDLEAELGRSADDREITIDGTRVSATATWPTGEGADGSNPEATDTPAPESNYETLVDEELSESEGYMLDFEEGDEVRVTVENLEGERTLVYMLKLGGSGTPINDGTSETETWEVEITESSEYSIDFTVDGRAKVTVEVARN